MNIFACFNSRKPHKAEPAAKTPVAPPSAGSDEKHTLETIAEGPESPVAPKQDSDRLSLSYFTPPALKPPPPVASSKSASSLHISSPNETGSNYLPTSPSFNSPRIDVDLESRMSTFNPYSVSPPASSSTSESIASGLALNLPHLAPPEGVAQAAQTPPITPVRAHPLRNEVKPDTITSTPTKQQPHQLANETSPPVPEKDAPRTLRPKSLHGQNGAAPRLDQAHTPIPRPRPRQDPAAPAAPSFSASYSPSLAPRISMSFARQSRLIPLDVLKGFSSDDFLGDFLKDTSFRESMDASMLGAGIPTFTDRATNRQTFASSHYSEYYEDNPDLQLELSRMRSMSRQASLHHKDSRSNRTSQYTNYAPADYEVYDHDKLARELAKEIESATRDTCDPSSNGGMYGKPSRPLSTVAASEQSGGASVPPSDFGSPRSEIHTEKRSRNVSSITDNTENSNFTHESNFTADSISTANSMNTMSNVTANTANTTVNSIHCDKFEKVVPVLAAAAVPAPVHTVAPAMPPSPPVSMRESIKDLPNHTVTHSYRPILEDEIEVRRGDTVKICQEFDDGWCLVTIVKMRSDDPENRRSIGSTMGYKEGVCPRACLALEV